MGKVFLTYFCIQNLLNFIFSGLNITVSTPAGDMGAGGQPRYVVAYTLKQTPEQPPPPQQKQPDILNPDSLQSLKDVTKLKSPTSPNSGIGMTGNSDYTTMYSSLPTQAAPLHDHTDGISIDNTILESTYPNHHNFFIQPPHYSILGSSTIGEPPHEYAKNYSTIIVSSSAAATTSSSTPYQTHTNQIPIDYSRLLNNGDADPSNLLISSNSNSNILLRNNHSSSAAANSNNEYRYSGSDFSMNESNTSTLGSKSNSRVNNSTSASNRSHIITDTLPGPESCV